MRGKGHVPSGQRHKRRRHEKCVVAGCRKWAREETLPLKHVRYLPVKGIKANVCKFHLPELAAKVDADILESLRGYA